MVSEDRPFNLAGKNIVITGGRTGLGRAMARCVAKAGGVPIIVSSAQAEVVEQAAAEVGGVGYQFDVTRVQEAKSFVEKLVKEHGHIDGLINNAGVHCKKPFADTDIQDYERIFEVHVLGAVALTRAVVETMKQTGEGSIIFISSMSAMIGMTKVAAYSAAKAAVLGLVKSLTGEYAEEGIRVNAISPGFIDTPMFHTAVDQDPVRQKKILEHTPAKRYGTPEDVGWAAVYLCADESKFVTGINLPVDGGCCIGF